MHAASSKKQSLPSTPLSAKGCSHPTRRVNFYEDELLAWIENGRRNTAELNYDQILATMQSGVRRKTKSGFGL